MTSKAFGLAQLGNAYADGALSNRNKVINGAMQVAQRGTSGSGVGSAGYVSLDRWRISIDTSSTVFLSQLAFAAGHSDVDRDLEYYAKFDWLGTGTAQTKTVSQRIEGVSSLNGQQVTISFYGRTELADDVIVKLKQNFGSGGSTEVTTSSSTIDLTASWAKYTVTLTLPSISGKTVGASSYLELQFSFGPATANSYFEFTGVQLEAGDTATPFEHRSYGQELALCQRYYYLPDGGQLGTIANNTTYAVVSYPFPVTMRANPTFSGTSATMVYTVPFVAGGATGQYNSVEGVGKNSSVINYSGLSRSDTAGTLVVVNTSDVQFSAEL